MREFQETYYKGLPLWSNDALEMKKKKKKNGGNFMELIISVYHLGLVMHMKWKINWGNFMELIVNVYHIGLVMHTYWKNMEGISWNLL